MELDKVKELFSATAEMTAEGVAARKEFAGALTTPILQKIELESIMRNLFTPERLSPGAQAVYPVAKSLATTIVI